jgi:hypothetical protein
MSGPKNRVSTLETKTDLQAMGFEPVPVLKAIRTKCLDCSGGMASEVRDCLVRNCALYPFRMGTNPWRAPVSDEHRQRAARIRFAAKNPPDGRGNGATDEAAVGGAPPNSPSPTP